MLINIGAQLFKISMGPPAETHNRRRRCSGVDYIPFVRKSHNEKEAKIFNFFCPAHFPISVSWKHPSTANAASSSVQLHCPKGLPTHTLSNWLHMNGSICQIVDTVLSTRSEAHSMFTLSRGDREDAPIALPYCWTEKRLTLDKFSWLRLS